MARERQLEGEETEQESQFSDVELDDDGNPIDGEEGEGDGDGDEGEDGDEDRGDSVLDDDDDDSDLDALEAVAGEQNVPRARLNQVLEENRRLRGIVEQAATTRGGHAGGEQQQRQQQDDTPNFDLKAKLKERADAMLEGDTDKIVALDEEIENYRNTVVRAQGEQAGRQAATAAFQESRMNEIIEAGFKRYPFLNDANAADFNQEALRDVVMYKNRYMEEGQSPAAALKNAINRVCPYYAEELGYTPAGKKGRSQKPAANGDDGSGGKRRRGVGGSADDANERDPNKIQRNARAANRLPPAVGRTGTGNAAVQRNRGERSAREIPASEWRNMPDAEKRRLRGDYV